MYRLKRKIANKDNKQTASLGIREAVLGISMNLCLKL